MRDFKKCGLVCPQELIKVVLEELNLAFDL